MTVSIPNPILIAAAVIPAVILLIYINRVDRLDKESPRLLLSLVIRGVFATFGALVAERLGSYILDSLFPADSTMYNVLLYFVVVACSEEGFKYLLLHGRTWSSPEFNCEFDGVVYAVFVSLGFALWENISYVLMYGLPAALARAVTAIPGHGSFGVFMGAWYGLAKRWQLLGENAQSRGCKVAAFIFPAFLHGSYDYIASIQDPSYGWVFLLFIVIMFFVAWRMIRRLSARDKYMESRDPNRMW